MRFVLFFFNWMVHYDEIVSLPFHQQIISVGFMDVLRAFPLRKQLCNSCLEHILTNRFLFSPQNLFFLPSVKSPEGFEATQHRWSLQ